MEHDERTDLVSDDAVRRQGRVSVSLPMPAELTQGTDGQRKRALEALADEAYEEALDILDQSPRVVAPVPPCLVNCQLTLQQEVEDLQVLCQHILEAVLQGFEWAALIEDPDGFLDLNSNIDVSLQVGDTDEIRFDFVVERIYERARARVARKRRQLVERRDPRTSERGAQGVEAGLRLIGLVIIAAAILAVVGSLLPWAEALGGLVKANGTDGDGLITLVVALIAGVLGLGVAFGRERSTAVLTGLGAFLCGGIIGAVTAYDLNNLNNVIEEVERESLLFDPGLSAGSGLYLTLVAGILMALASVVAVMTAQDRAAG